MSKTHHPSSREERLALKRQNEEKKKLRREAKESRLTKRFVKEALKDKETRHELQTELHS